MKQRKVVSMIGMLVVLVGTLFMMTGCGNKPFNYLKENVVLKFKNETGPAIAKMFKDEGVDAVILTAG